jgi:hypothetical protein
MLTNAHMSHAGKNAPKSEKVGALFGAQPLSVAIDRTISGIGVQRVVMAQSRGAVALHGGNRRSIDALALQPLSGVLVRCLKKY